MSLLHLIVLFVVVGVVLWAINRFVPMQSTVKSILNIVVILFLVIVILKALGVISWLGSITV